MKKIIAGLTTLMCILALAGCSEKEVDELPTIEDPAEELPVSELPTAEHPTSEHPK